MRNTKFCLENLDNKNLPRELMKLIETASSPKFYSGKLATNPARDHLICQKHTSCHSRINRRIYTMQASGTMGNSTVLVEELTKI